MTGFVVSRFGYREKRLIKKIVNKKKIKRYSICSYMVQNESPKNKRYVKSKKRASKSDQN